MRSFKDTEGRQWILSINVATVKRLKDKINVDLLDQLGIGLLEEIAQNPVRLADVLFVVCQAEVIDRGLDDVAFGSALSGDVLEAAATALCEAITDFFPSARRQVIAKALGKMQAIERAAVAKATATLDSPLIEQAIEETFRQAATKIAIKLQAACGELSGMRPAS